MAIITPEGLFRGDRLRRCSQEAQLMWPRYFIASNTCARFEISYQAMLDNAFLGLKSPPTEEAFLGHMTEYLNEFLLFVYRVNGEWWGQWDTPEGMLQRHKLKADLRTPAPPEEEFKAWREEYQRQKALRSARVGDILSVLVPKAVLQNPAKNLEILQKFGGNVRGVGVGVGEERTGEERNLYISSPPEDSDSQIQAILTIHPRVEKPREAERALVGAIITEVPTRGDQGALNYLRERTQLYRKLTDDWPPGQERFKMEAVNFYRTGAYKADEKLWQKGAKSAFS